MKLCLSIIILLSVSIGLQAQNFELLGAKFADSMCICIEQKHGNKEITEATMNVYFEYCKGFVFNTLKDDIAELESLEDDAQQRLAKALSTKLMSDCPFLFPYFVGAKLKNSIMYQCEELLIHQLEVDKYSKEICSCFTNKYIQHMGTDSRMMKLLEDGQTLDLIANYPLTITAMNESIALLYDQDVLDTEFAIEMERKLFKMSMYDNPKCKGVNLDNVFDCLYKKQVDYMFDNTDVPVENWPKDLDQIFLDTCLKEVKSGTKIKEK